jgi:hypothetical protein
MQFGRSTKIFKLEYIFLFAAFGASVLRAQGLGDFGQALGNTSGQSSCGPTDPGCQSGADQSSDQGDFQNQGAIGQGAQQPVNRGAVLPGQQGSQQSANSETANRT